MTDMYVATRTYLFFRLCRRHGSMPLSHPMEGVQMGPYRYIKRHHHRHRCLFVRANLQSFNGSAIAL